MGEWDETLECEQILEVRQGKMPSLSNDVIMLQAYLPQRFQVAPGPLDRQATGDRRGGLKNPLGQLQ
jgi:hypothetical protein